MQCAEAAHLSEVVETLIEQLEVIRFAMYVMDSAAPLDTA